MRRFFTFKVLLCVLLAVPAWDYSQAEPAQTVAHQTNIQRKERAFRPLVPLGTRTVPASAYSNQARKSATLVISTPETRIVQPPEPAAAPSFAGAESDLYRIPPPPIPEGQKTATPEFLPPTPPEEPEVKIATSPEGFYGPTSKPQEPSYPDYQDVPQPAYTHVADDGEVSKAESLPETVSSESTPELGSGEEPEKPEIKEDIPEDAPTLSKLRERANKMSTEGLKYIFGADNPEQGGLDCSGVVQYLLTGMGIEDVPRTSYDQYDWLKNKKMLDDVFGKKADEKLYKKLAPGDLIFWGNTWNSGHRVSHVMIYMGWDPNTDKHYIFGAQSSSSKGINGNGVDIFELDPNRGRLIGHGKIPGLIYD